MWFDGQADRFDDRAGLGPEVGRHVARAVLELSGAGAGDLVLDLGAGTGAVGRHLAALPCRYLGLDRSERMLGVFRRSLGEPPPYVLLALADGDRPWPVRAGTVAVVFASRVVHHLRAAHVVGEVFRACRPVGCLLLGRVVRNPDSVPSRLQRYKRALLAEHGLDARGGGRAVREVVEACCSRGAKEIEPATVARWTRAVTPRQLLAAWAEKPRLTSGSVGGELTVGRRAVILDALTDWAQREFGDLDSSHEVAEEYMVEGARLP